MFARQEAPYPAAVTLDQEMLRALAVEYLVRTLWALIVIIVAILVGRLVERAAAAGLQRRRAHPNVVVLVGNLTRLAVFILATLVVLAIYTRENFGWILTSFSVLGLVLGLSLQDILKNFFAGIYVLIERPFRIGDTVTVAEHTGVVEEISFRTMQLRTEDGREVIIPNGLLMLAPVVNLTRYPTRSARLSLTLPADQAGPETERRVAEALSAAPGMAADQPPTVVLRGSAAGKATYQITLWGKDRDRAAAEGIAALRSMAGDWDVQAP